MGNKNRLRRFSTAICLSVCLVVKIGLGGLFTPVPLSPVANASRIDEMPADGKGGWLDLGSNDLRVLPAGLQDFGGVTFDVPVCSNVDTRACLVLGRNGQKEAELVVPAGIRGGRFYLLHAIADGPAAEKRTIVATIKLQFANGLTKERHIRVGRDVADWTSSKTYENAIRVWSAYNDNTQVSLFLSGFDLDSRSDLKSIKFTSTVKCPWMIVAATSGRAASIKGLRAESELNGTFRAPPARTKALQVFPAGVKPKNVILLIGDGMGLGAVRYTSLYQHGREDALQMQQMPFAGFCTTVSVLGGVTDSAAAATAIATGFKTMNSALGMRVTSPKGFSHPQPLVSIAEKAHDNGCSVAILTNDKITGATPGGFYAHVPSRGKNYLIATQAATCGYEILVGASNSVKDFRLVANGGGRNDGRDILAEMEKGGYVFVRSQQEFDQAAPDKKVIGAFLDEAASEDSVAQVLKTALARIGDAPKGFFMMCESALPDHGNHGNKPRGTVMGTLQVDWAASVALDFAEKRGDTLVIVTADHETGAVNAIRSRSHGKVTINYSTNRHTDRPVAIFAYGPGAEYFEGQLDNTDIAKVLTYLMALNEEPKRL